MTSTLKFNRWENAAGQAIADAASGSLSLGRNLLYNGAMQVTQRGTTATGLTNGSSGYHTADRWRFQENGAPTYEATQTVEADGPSGSGFTKSLKMDITTAQGSLAAADRMVIQHRLEGQDLQGIKKGTAEAESLTLSFWVKSNVTDTFVVTFEDGSNSRYICATYSVSSADTWEKKTITIPGDTVGALDNDNAVRFNIWFWLACGSDLNTGTLPTSWQAGAASIASGQTNLAASTSNYWQVTGVQLETGTVASGFDHKSYGVELAECERYYYLYVPAQPGNNVISIGSAYDATQIETVVVFKNMRNAPSLVHSTGTNYYKLEPSATTFNNFVLAQQTNNTALLLNTNLSGLGTNNAYRIETNNDAAFIAFDAEL